jgi:hypothetical protein
LRAGLHAASTAALGAAALLLSAALPSRAAGSPAVPPPSGEGPRQLLITYRAQPADRPAFRRYLLTDEARRLEALERQGVLAHYQILFNPFVQPRTWDAMTILTFRRFTDTASWQRVEQSAPGGLDAAGLKLARPVGTYSADLTWQGAASDPGPLGDHVFYVIPYTYGSKGQYESYVAGYVLPQLRAWIQAGVLSRYRIYLNRYPVGDPEPWDALFVYEYRDLAAFGRRDVTLAAARRVLDADPAWAALAAAKAGMRSEAENTIAGPLAGR